MHGSYGTFKIDETGRFGDKITDVIYNDERHDERIEGATLRETLFNRTTRHRNIMRHVSIIQHGKQVHTRMPAARETLRAFVKRHGIRERIRQSHHTLVDIMQALAFMHGNGIAHGDLKPENVVVRHDGLVQLIDFGAVHWQLETGIYQPTYTSYWFVPPEDALDDQYGTAADVWAVGLIMIFYWTRQHPVCVSSRRAAAVWFSSHRQIEIPRAIPRKMRALIARMLDYNPATRITAEGVLHELGVAPIPGTVRPVPRMNITLANKIAGRHAFKYDYAACASYMADIILTPMKCLYTVDMARAIWGVASRRSLRRLHTITRQLMQNIR